MRGYIPPKTSEEKLLCKRVEELYSVATNRYILRFMPFLTDREQNLAKAVLQKLKCESYMFYGGTSETERKMLAISYSQIYENEFPLFALEINCKSKEKLTHRDYLGALMSLRIERELLGDIIVLENKAILFCHENAAPIVFDELLEVGNAQVTVEYAQSDTLQKLEVTRANEIKTITLASLRLDALLGAMLKISRGNAANLIKGNCVQINHVETTSCHEPVYEGDVFTVRGKGKFKLCHIGGQSKKDRTFVSYIEF